MLPLITGLLLLPVLRGGFAPAEYASQNPILRRGGQEVFSARYAPEPSATEGISQEGKAVAPDTRNFSPTPHYQKGQTFRYQTKGSMGLRFVTAAGADASPEILTALDVIHRYTIRENRTGEPIQLSMLSEGGKIRDASGSLLALPADPKNLVRSVILDTHSRLLSLKEPRQEKQSASLDSFLSQSNLLLQLHFLPWSEKPRHVGESWTVRYPINGKETKPEEEAGKPNAVKEDYSAIRVTLTLLGVEKYAGHDILKIRQTLIMPDERSVDAKGKLTPPEKAAGRIRTLLNFTQTVYIVAEDGQMLRSEGEVSGEVRFEGSIARQVPGETMKITGHTEAQRLPEEEEKSQGEPQKEKKAP